MPELSLAVEKAEVTPFAAAPTLAFQLRLENAPAEEAIQTVALHCQIQIEATRRSYTAAEQEQLRDLFGEPERWSQTLHTLLWTHTQLIVPAFRGSTVVNLPVPCSFDFNVAATKYFYGLAGGEVPLNVQFSGTVFHATPSGLQVAPIPWNREARFRLPVAIWREMMDVYYPNSAWLRLSRSTFERLHRYKTHHGIPTWEEAIESILCEAPEEVRR